MYICVKLPPGNLNPSHCPPHLTNTYTCRVTIAPRICDGKFKTSLLEINFNPPNVIKEKKLTCYIIKISP